MLGFGFNKERTRAAAERYVQQNKLPQAIVEYEKLIKHEPNDLTVLNTIGDLYARVGKAEQAISNFRTVGDAYAKNGFTVKAIAMYKKITKLNPNLLDCVERLAELFADQKLIGDARAQFAIVADARAREGRHDEAVRILERVLALDPENLAILARLAELHIENGKRSEAHNLLVKTANFLFERKSFDSAKDVLGRVLKLDPQDMRALELHGKALLELKDPAGAVKDFEQVADIDSRHDGLKAQLRGYIELGKMEEANATARRLKAVHRDPSGILQVAEQLFLKNQHLEGLRLIDEFQADLLASSGTTVSGYLHSCVSKLKTSAEGLEMLHRLFQRAGDVSQIGEVLELRAQVATQNGDLEVARDLYHELMVMEPDNSTHVHSYRQLCVKLGQSTPEEAEAPAVPEPAESTAAPTIKQTYSSQIEEIIRIALSEAELCESFNAPANALPTLEAALQRAPDDIRLNNALASIYIQTNTPEKAKDCYGTLYRVYNEAGAYQDAAHFAQLAGVEAESPRQISVRLTSAEESTAGLVEPALSSAAPVFTDFVVEEPVPPASDELAPVEGGGVEEIDLSDEWQSVWQQDVGANQGSSPQPEPVQEPDKLQELLQEIDFYLQQSMWREAQMAVEKLSVLAPEHPALAKMRQQLANAQSTSTADNYSPGFELVVEPVEDTDVSARVETAPTTEPLAPAFLAEPSLAASTVFPLEPASQTEAPSADVEPLDEIGDFAAQPLGELAQTEPAKGGVLDIGDLSADLDAMLGDDFLLTPEPKVAEAPTVSVTAPVVDSPVPAPASAAENRPAASTEEQSPSFFSDLIDNFNEELGTEAEENPDPETHYGLGVAFREMGLLDEAIGEFQKVCRFIESGHEFSQPLQTYTWLATCFVEKGVPEAAFKWYDRALSCAKDEESRAAIHYDLAAAYEAAGRKNEALSHFMEVLGINIDYRDTADRVRELRAS